MNKKINLKSFAGIYKNKEEKIYMGLKLSRDLSLIESLDILHILLKTKNVGNYDNYIVKDLINDITGFLMCKDGYGYDYIDIHYASFETIYDNKIYYGIFINVLEYLLSNDLLVLKKPLFKLKPISVTLDINDNIKGFIMKRDITYLEAKHILCNILGIYQDTLVNLDFDKDERFLYKQSLINDITLFIRGDLTFNDLFNSYANDDLENIHCSIFYKLIEYLIKKDIIEHD